MAHEWGLRGAPFQRALSMLTPLMYEEPTSLATPRLMIFNAILFYVIYAMYYSIENMLLSCGD